MDPQYVKFVFQKLSFSINEETGYKLELFDIDFHDCTEEEFNEFYEMDDNTRKTFDAL